MKNTKINLLVVNDQYKKRGRFFRYLRALTIGYTVLICLGLIIFVVINLLYAKQISYLNNQKKQLLSKIQQRTEDETKLIYISKKVNLIDQYLKDDAQFEPYYNLLLDSLSDSTESAKLSSFLIDKNREVNFQVKFDDFSDVIVFLTFVESDRFVENFEILFLENFKNISNKESQKEATNNYELSFRGKFINLKQQ